MANPYSAGNPYIVRTPKNRSGGQLVNMGLQLYAIKNRSGLKLPEWRFGKTAPGDATNIPGLNAQGGESLVSPGTTEPDLSAFDFDTGDIMAEEAVMPESTYAAEEALTSGILTAAEAAELEALGAVTAETGAETGATAAGATAGGIFSTAVPYVGAAKAGMPIVGSMMEEWSPGKPGSSNVFQQGARLTKNQYYRPIEAIHEGFGIEVPEVAEAVFNPAGYIFGKLF